MTGKRITSGRTLPGLNSIHSHHTEDQDESEERANFLEEQRLSARREQLEAVEEFTNTINKDDLFYWTKDPVRTDQDFESSHTHSKAAYVFSCADARRVKRERREEQTHKRILLLKPLEDVLEYSSKFSVRFEGLKRRPRRRLFSKISSCTHRFVADTCPTSCFSVESRAQYYRRLVEMNPGILNFVAEELSPDERKIYFGSLSRNSARLSLSLFLKKKGVG